MQNLTIQPEKENLDSSFFVPISNLYFDEALKSLKANEFKTYMGVTATIKEIGPNTQLYFSNKKELFKKCSSFLDCSEKTFLIHLKTLHLKGILDLKENVFDIGYNIADSKSYGFTPIDIDLLKYLLETLSSNEFKLYMTIYRLLRGFNQKSSSYSYAQLKTWSGIKNKTTFNKARSALVNKKLIVALLNVQNGRHTFKLCEFSPELKEDESIERTQEIKTQRRTSEDVLKHQKEDLQHRSHTAEDVLQPLIKKYNPFLNKYFKKSCSKQSPTYSKKAQLFEKENRKKILRFLSENLKTKDLSETQKHNLIEELVQDVKENGGFKGVKIKTTISFYLSQEHPQFGRNIDKIIDRYFYDKEQERRDNEGRGLFLKACSKYYPEEVQGLEDFEENDISRYKLDQLIKKTPGIGYFQDSFIFRKKEIKNPKFDTGIARKSQAYMDQLIAKETEGREVDFEERLTLVERFIPQVEKKYPQQDEIIIQRRKLTFEKFCTIENS